MTVAASARLLERFAAHAGRPARVLVRAPGRVNLIGEHTDYNGLPVLPMAIDRQIWVAGAPRDDATVRIFTDGARYGERTYTLAAEIPRFAAGDWGNYHKAAAQGLLTALGADALRGGDFLIAGDLPSGAGLSSSSALVVGSMLALLAVSGRTMDRAALAELAATSERYVGTQSGGMDQAVCLLAEADHALRIDFDPLRTRVVPIGPGAAIVVCHSLVEAEKSGAARAAYNRRVAECRFACRVLDRMLDRSRPLAHLGELRTAYPDRSLRECAALLERTLPGRALTLDELAAATGVPIDTLSAAVEPDADREATYAVVRRARHVCSEAERVDAAERALAAADWAALGDLMNASHASCRDDYEVSSAALEELVAAARAAGALGARLTGAGFGGCTVNLVPAAEAARFIAALEGTFYRDRPAARLREHAFVVTPSAGASVHRV